MTMEEFMSVHHDPEVDRLVWRAARRFTKCPEDQEEYVNDAWMRICEAPAGKRAEFYGNVAQKAIRAAYMRKRYVPASVKKNLNGISEDVKIPRSGLKLLGRDRYLVLKPEKLSSWYYHGEWAEYGLPKDGYQVRTFYKIVVK